MGEVDLDEEIVGLFLHSWTHRKTKENILYQPSYIMKQEHVVNCE